MRRHEGRDLGPSRAEDLKGGGAWGRDLQRRETKSSFPDAPTQMHAQRGVFRREINKDPNERRGGEEKKGWRIRHDLAGRITRAIRKPVDSHVSCAHFCGRDASATEFFRRQLSWLL